ncbi:hypothetical protein BDZ85DRAFT_185069, partial [Elsinoe ampelina]
FRAELGQASEYVGTPSKKMDALWDAIIDLPMILIDAETMNRLEQQTSNAKGRNGKYYAMVEVFHQLHCLNMLRKSTRREYYQKDSALGDAEHIGLIHHCIDILRQVLMCNADTGLITFTDVGQDEWPSPRFSTKHTCRNYSAVVEWV